MEAGVCLYRPGLDAGLCLYRPGLCSGLSMDLTLAEGGHTGGEAEGCGGQQLGSEQGVTLRSRSVVQDNYHSPGVERMWSLSENLTLFSVAVEEETVDTVTVLSTL